MKKEFEMTAEQLEKLLDSCKPTPCMLIGGVNTGSSAQKNANSAWKALGDEMGFDHMTVQPVWGKGQRFFTADAVERHKSDPVREASKSPPLKWEFDNSGWWNAVSQIMDPAMTDEPQPQWCREWCLSWTIYVDEDGDFSMEESDSLLLKEAYDIQFGDVYHELMPLKVLIEELEQKLRLLSKLPRSGVDVVLLPVEVYAG